MDHVRSKWHVTRAGVTWDFRGGDRTTCREKSRGDDWDRYNWPQPQGIYGKGVHFYPIEFLKTLQDMYEMVVVCGERSTNLLMGHEAFGEVVQRRTSIEEDSTVLFRLYDLLMLPSTPDSLVVLCNRCKHLRLDCLRDD